MVKIKLKVPAGEARTGPPLAPILGQHQINLMEFCKFFNNKSLELYSQGVPVKLKIYKKQGLSNLYEFKPISFNSLTLNFFLYSNKGRFLKTTQLYDMYRLRVLDLKRSTNLVEKNKRSIASNLFNFCVSLKLILKNG